MKLSIKNMVCPRCIMAVREILKREGIEALDVSLGKAVVDRDLSGEEIGRLRKDLESVGFELLDDSQKQLIEQVKAIVIQRIHFSDKAESNLSRLLTEELHRDYSFLSKLFSATEGMTIEHYAILQKIEKVKELLSYDRQTLSEISYSLGYSSVAHLSSQFKKVTGMTPTQFKNQGIALRKNLDNLS